ncbi:MAG: (2Fe-2S)-binding protein [Planctomycetes bacterium]|nr:(2Fe-2S)-binding protein [Planctomycetota bacterium]
MVIDRCVCFDLTFATVLEKARAQKQSFEEVELSLGCGGGCGLCRPYLRRCLRTGQTSFVQILTDQDEPGSPARS